jgi:hypothetical protein
MPRDTPPPTKKPRQQKQPPAVREQTPPPQPKSVEKVPEPEVRKEGPSATIEEAFLRAGATVIEAAPVIRDFEKEATSFVPSVVKRRPMKKPANPVDTKAEEQKSFATTVEDEEETGEETPVVETLKRPLPVEKVEASAPAPAPPKRRRMVNAAPDV